MKHNRTFPVIMGLLGAPLTLTAGCSHQTPEQQQMQNTGDRMQQAGMMSQADYTEIRRMTADVRQSGKISDSDLDRATVLLKSSSDQLAQARILTMFSIVKSASSTQKNKMESAISPFLTSPSKLLQAASGRAQKTLQTL